MSMAPRSAVDPAAAVPPRVGLIASARGINRVEESTTTDGARWEAGFAVAPEGACPPARTSVTDNCSDDGVTPIPAKTFPDNPATIEYEPVVVYGTDSCSNYERSRDREGRARRNLGAGLSAAIAKELWRGDLAQAFSLPNPYLAQAVTISGAAKSPLDALAALEGVYYAEGGVMQAMIHAAPATLDYWKTLQLVERVGNVFYTANDNLVVADAGYDGSAPNGDAAADGSWWAYISPVVGIRLGPVDVLTSSRTPGAATTDNLTQVIAERLTAATFESPCDLLFAAEIDQPLFTAP